MNARRDALLVAAITLLALALRGLRLEFQPLWWDEGYSVWFANQPLAEMLRLTALDIHPPLYYALLGGWGRLFGLGPAALRLFSVAAGVLAVPVIYQVGRWLGGRRAGLLAALLLAISPFHVFYSQEVRMYALVALFGLLALGSAARWLHVGKHSGGGWWLAGYVAFTALALYTQYYAGFLAAGLALAGVVVLWRQRAGWRRLVVWLAAQAAVALLYVPWIRFAAPRLVPYVSQKIVADSDRPLGLPEYLARHLAAYVAGHLEGPRAPWWPLGLLGLLVLAWALWRIFTQHRRAASDLHVSRFTLQPLLFLSITLTTVLLLGWLVNLGFPFFPQRGERVLLLGLPVFLLLVAVAVAGVGYNSEFEQRMGKVSSAGRAMAAGDEGSRRIGGAGGGWVLVASLLLFAAVAGVSLAAFYTVPRYTEEDYRPLVGQVIQWGRPDDTVFAVFPWQVGYFWSYGQPDGPQPLLSPGDDWGPQVAQALDAALARGHLWFPEHLSLGGLLEAEAERYLARHSHLLANRWYSPSTRLTGWATAFDAQRLSTGPFSFDNGARLTRVDVGPLPVMAANDALLVDLAWEDETAAPRYLTVRLAGGDGRTWAQQDYTLTSPSGTDAIGLVVPSGTPPGQYELRVALLDAPGGAPSQVTGPDGELQGGEAQAGQVEVVAPGEPPSPATLAFQQPRQAILGDAVELLGFSATPGPLRPGDDLLVNLFWRALPGLADQPNDLLAFVQLLDAQGQVAAAWEGPPVAWRPTREWQAGELVRSQHSLRLPATLADGQYQLIVGLFDAASRARLPAAGPRLPRAADYVPLERLTVQNRPHVLDPPSPQVSLQADLARLGRLVGYDLTAAQVAPGQPLDLTLHWQATGTTDQRLAVFVHLLDEQGAIVGQSDGEPGRGSLPTSSWQPGEYLEDPHRIVVKPDAPAGPARLVVGLYDPANGQRVPWVDATGQVTGETLQLPSAIDVTGP